MGELAEYSGSNSNQELSELTRLLRASIDGRLGSLAEGSATLDMDPIFHEAFVDVAKTILEKRLGGLSNAAISELYARESGEPTLLAMLEETRAARSINDARELDLQKIAVEAQRTRVLKLSDLAVGEIISIGLFRSNNPGQANKRSVDNQLDRPFLRNLEVRLVDPQIGSVELMHDNWRGASWDESAKAPEIRKRTLGVIGSVTLSAAGETFEPGLFLHSQPSYKFGQDTEFTTPDQIIGYVETADERLLLNG